MTQREKKVSELLHNSQSKLGQLLERVFHFDDLEKTFSELLDPIFSKHVRRGSYQNGSLVLLAESGPFATQLKFQIPNLIEKLRSKKEWSGLRNIEIKVAPHLYAQKASFEPHVESKPRTIPEDASQLINQVANSLEDTPESKDLKEALLRLGGTS